LTQCCGSQASAGNRTPAYCVRDSQSENDKSSDVTTHTHTHTHTLVQQAFSRCTWVSHSHLLLEGTDQNFSYLVSQQLFLRRPLQSIFFYHRSHPQNNIPKNQAQSEYKHSLTFRIRTMLSQAHSNETHAPIANPPNNAQLRGIPYHSAKLHPGPCSRVGM